MGDILGSLVKFKKKKKMNWNLSYKFYRIDRVFRDYSLSLIKLMGCLEKKKN